MSTEIPEINEGELVYLSPLTLISVKAEYAKGRFGLYQSGYRVVLALEDGSTQVSIIAKRNADWFAQLNATRIKNPTVKRFAFEVDPLSDSGKLKVNGILA